MLSIRKNITKIYANEKKIRANSILINNFSTIKMEDNEEC